MSTCLSFCHYSMINMSVHVSVRLTYVTVSKPFSVRGSLEWGGVFCHSRGGAELEQRCPKVCKNGFPKHGLDTILKNIGLRCMTFLWSDVVSKPWGPWGYCLGMFALIVSMVDVSRDSIRQLWALGSEFLLRLLAHAVWAVFGVCWLSMKLKCFFNSGCWFLPPSYSHTMTVNMLQDLQAYSTCLKYRIIITSSTAQGGGGSFKNRKPTGEVGCEKEMEERSHWWIDRWLRSPLSLFLWLPTYLPTHLPTYLPTYLPTDLFLYLSIHLSIYLSIHLSIYLSLYLYLYLSI